MNKREHYDILEFERYMEATYNLRPAGKIYDALDTLKAIDRYLRFGGMKTKLGWHHVIVNHQICTRSAVSECQV